MTTRYTCQADEISEEPITYETETPSQAAEQYVDENLEFDPTDPQSVIQVNVEYPHPEFNDRTMISHIDVTIVLNWTACAMATEDADTHEK